MLLDEFRLVMHNLFERIYQRQFNFRDINNKRKTLNDEAFIKGSATCECVILKLVMSSHKHTLYQHYLVNIFSGVVIIQNVYSTEAFLN